MRLIDADALKEEITSAFHGALGATVTIATHELIDKQPTIDPESLRPHGRWIQAESAWGQKQLECSCCGSKWPEYARFFAYCPICGAKMEDWKDE